jgi:quercetin dioxygenase-like cupin family protein
MNNIRISAAMLLLALPLPAGAQSVKVNPLLSTEKTDSGQPIVLPRGDAEVVTSMYEIPVGAKLPEHKHIYQRYGYVLSGQLRITNTATGKSIDFKAGDFIVESRNQWHKAENTGTEPIKLLVIDQVKPGQNNTVLRKQDTTSRN